MNKENIRRRIRNVTAFAAALLLAASFSLPSGTEIMGVRLGNAIVASADVRFDLPGFYCSLDDNGTLFIDVVYGSGAMPEWNIERDVPWYIYRSEIKSVQIGEGVTSIGNYAFYGCESLTSITIPSDVTSIGNYAFASCESLKTITIPSKVNSIGNCAFENCWSLESIFLPKDLDVSSASIPASATKITYTVTDSNVTVTEVTLGSDQSSFTIPDTIDGKTVTAVCIKEGTTGVVVPDTTTQIKYSVYDNSNVKITNVTPGEGVTSVTVPDTIDGKKVTAVGDSAFYRCSDLTSIVLPDGLTYIGERAFCGCSSLTSIILPDGVTSIGSNAFQACGGLTSIKIPDGVSSIGDFTFYWCSGLKTVELPDGLNSIGSGAFEDCSGLTSINLPDGVTSIGYNAFQSCSVLTSIKIPGSVSSIGNYTFNRCSGLKTVELPDGLKSIGEKAFGECTGLTSINIPKGVTSIESSAFYGCSSFESITVDENNQNYSSEDGVLFNKGKTSLLIYPQNKSDASYEIPNGVDSIGVSLFSQNNNLKSITIPDSVKSIGDWAFYYCSSLEIIYIPSSVTSVGRGAFYGCEKLGIILYPQGVDVSGAALPETTIQMAYAVDTNNSDNILITGVKLGSGQTSFTIPETIEGKKITAVSNNALADCTALESIIIPKNVDITNAGIPASAAQIRYTVDNDNVTITAVTLGGDASGFVLPDKIDGKEVTYLDDGALATCPTVEHTHREKIAATCTSQAVCAICNTGYGDALGHKLESHGMCTVCGDGAEVCGEKAHYVFDNNTGTLTIFGEGSVTKDDWYDTTFIDSAKKIVIESGITDFEYIFFFRKVESISYPDTITEIEFANFSSDTKNLTRITIDKNNNNYCAVDNVVFSKDKTKLYYYLSNNPAEEYVIPEGVTSIEFSAFESCQKLKNITIPSGVQNIGSGAFQCCNSLESITLPSSVTTVGWFAFYSCENLETIFIPDGKDVSEAGIPDTTTKVFYSADDDGNASITSITLGTNRASVNIPVTIDGNKVISVAKECQQYVGKHTHVGGEATCASKAVCALCGNGYGETGAHSLTKHDAVSASCTTDGSIEYYECSECGKLFTDSTGETETTLDKVKITSTGHKFGTAWESNTEGHYHVCTVCNEQSASEAHTKDDGTVTKEATPTESGTITYKCKVCGELMGQSIITATISSFEVTENGVVVKYTVTGSSEVKSKTYAFSEVTVEWVEMMKKENIKLVIDFVNYSTAADGSKPVILTAAQLKAIEYVLENDLK